MRKAPQKVANGNRDNPRFLPVVHPVRHTPRRGLSRVEASAYIGVSPSKFDEMVVDGRMPKPRQIDGRVVWDKWELDDAFTALPHKGETSERNPWDGEAA
jgi:predicted DNA-binding transcriptional regulator AlpA